MLHAKYIIYLTWTLIFKKTVFFFFTEPMQHDLGNPAGYIA